MRNWLVFEAEITRTLEPASLSDFAPIITLGGEDERAFWEMWHRGCSDDLDARVQHSYLMSIPMPFYRTVWQEPVLTTRTTGHDSRHT